jgi:hypothetical protein
MVRSKACTYRLSCTYIGRSALGRVSDDFDARRQLELIVRPACFHTRRNGPGRSCMHVIDQPRPELKSRH